MKTLIPLSLLFTVFVFSCTNEGTVDSGQNSNSEDPDTSTVLDSIVDEIIQIPVDSNRRKIDVSALFDKATENFELPLKIDSTFLEKYAITGDDAEYNLTYQEAQHLGFSFPDGNLSNSQKWQIQTFVNMDSLKQSNKLEDYLSSLDIGQARYATANMFGKVKVSDQTTILLWSSDYATYEACPYGEGVYIFGTVFTNQTATQTSLLGQESGGGDAPVWGDEYLESEITDSTISIYRLETWGEEDYETGEEIIEKREMHEVLGLSAYGLMVLEKDDYDY
ncbi:MAG: hypothetical protein ABJG68_00560 [Crocinitomicaceae bacterium]